MELAPVMPMADIINQSLGLIALARQFSQQPAPINVSLYFQRLLFREFSLYLIVLKKYELLMGEHLSFLLFSVTFPPP